MAVVIGSVIVFPVVIVALTLALLAAETRLKPKGKVKITINGDPEKAIESDAGDTLLSTLSNAGVMLPSACGGGGTCGVCKCQVTAGGGDILPTEQSHINYRESKEDWRLSCQVKVREDMEIVVPDEVFSINKWDCEVITNESVATYIREFTLRLPEGENLNFESGGYIQIEVPPFEADFKDFGIEEEYLEEWTRLGVLDLHTRGVEPVARAYSMANHPAEGNIVMLNIRIATPPVNREKRAFEEVMPGLASSYVYSRKVGDTVTISGPYGEFFMQETDREMCYIGGGAGMAPLRSHIFHLFHTLKTGRKVSYWYGARSRREIFYEDHFRKIEKEFPNFSFHIALSEPLPEDNWDGPVGFIHQVVQDQYLETHDAPEDIEYYLCGPPLMLGAVRTMLDDLGVEPEMIRFDEF
ncbi:MAG: NADH:ubiquinone reductase (Na(+)-transporting) subunit F [Spirochaetaceae bacterium]|nr:NADH:ubiquinone reductase (Na(+)-transporting) subunit F [Spirochaetaceae bacterium]